MKIRANLVGKLVRIVPFATSPSTLTFGVSPTTMNVNDAELAGNMATPMAAEIDDKKPMREKVFPVLTSLAANDGSKLDITLCVRAHDASTAAAMIVGSATSVSTGASASRDPFKIATDYLKLLTHTMKCSAKKKLHNAPQFEKLRYLLGDNYLMQVLDLTKPELKILIVFFSNFASNTPESKQFWLFLVTQMLLLRYVEIFATVICHGISSEKSVKALVSQSMLLEAKTYMSDVTLGFFSLNPTLSIDEAMESIYKNYDTKIRALINMFEILQSELPYDGMSAVGHLKGIKVFQELSELFNPRSVGRLCSDRVLGSQQASNPFVNCIDILNLDDLMKELDRIMRESIKPKYYPVLSPLIISGYFRNLVHPWMDQRLHYVVHCFLSNTEDFTVQRQEMDLELAREHLNNLLTRLNALLPVKEEKIEEGTIEEGITASISVKRARQIIDSPPTQTKKQAIEVKPKDSPPPPPSTKTSKVVIRDIRNNLPRS
jgi:hypothetical protein